jgi:Glutaredoxin-like domain (DUF836)
LSGAEAPAPLRLLTRADCSLCEVMSSELAGLAARTTLPPVELVDVDADPELQRRYGLKIPVLLWGTSPVCHFRLDESELLRLLRRP